MSALPARRRQRGFTLVELIVVMVVMGIIGGMVAGFLRLPVQNYVDATARAELVDVADTAMRRFARDLRRALPNSVRVSADGKTLELLLTKTGGRYLAEEDDLPVAGALNFIASAPSATPNQFVVVGALPTGREAIVAGDWIVVYNLGDGIIPVDAYDCTGQCNRARVTAVAAATRTITMANNPFVAQTPPMPSPTSRFQVVTTPVTYYCKAQSTDSAGKLVAPQLVRYAGYTIQATQPAASALDGGGANPAASHALLAANVAGCTFSTVGLANVQRGLVSAALQLGTAGGAAGVVTLNYQVHVDNTP